MPSPEPMAEASAAPPVAPGPEPGPEPTPPLGSLRGGVIFVVVVVFALLAGYLFGSGAGHHHGGGAADPSATAGGHQHGAPPASGTPAAAAGPGAGGLSATAEGYTLAVDPTVYPLGSATPVRFTIRGPDGAFVTRYETVHDKRLHLIVARADLSGYRHLHPELGADGVWSIPLTLDAPGTWRMYADFTTTDASGRRIAATLGATLDVAGQYVPAALPAPATATTVDGLTVTLDGAPRAGTSSPVLLRVARAGQPVTDLDRYLGAPGHLVVLRAADGGYLHVHPDEKLVDGAVRFWVSPPGPGRYRAYFDFSVGGVVRTAEFTLQV